MLELLKDVEECKSKPRSGMNKIPTKNYFLEPIKEKSKSIKHAKNDIVNNLAGKPPHEIFEQYLDTELKLNILKETNRYTAQKNTTTSFIVKDLETFNPILVLTGYHSLPLTRMFWPKEDDIGLSIVCEAVARKEFEALKSFIHFADNNALDTSDQVAKVRILYDIMNKKWKQFGFSRLFTLLTNK